MWDWARPYVSRMAGAAAAGISAKVAEKTGVVVDPATLIAGGLAVYNLVHKLVDKKVNPSDSASKHLAVEIQPYNK